MSDERLTRIEDKIDKLNSHLHAIDVTLTKQHEQLVYHIKRTDILEEKIKPIHTFVSFVVVALKLLGITALVAGIKKALS